MKWELLASAMALAIPALAHTSVSAPSPFDITATQVILNVTTDQQGNCTYRISEGSSFIASVNDVNPALFPGSNSDARTGAIINGNSHVFVGGTRTAARAADGNYYSRALQANTMHWAGVKCGTDAEVSITFQTLNPPLGDQGPELMPFDTTAFGNVAAPSIQWNNRSATYVDPMTGVLLRRMTDVSDLGFWINSAAQFNQGIFSFGISSNGHWSNAANAASGGSSSVATCDTSAGCTNSDALLLIAQVSRANTGFRPNGSWDPEVHIADFLVRVFGSGTDPNAANRTITACLTLDDQTCYGNSQTIVLPQSAVAFAGTIPQSWSVQAPWSGTAATTLTNITVAGGTATVNFVSAHGLTAGGTICVNGVRNQTVASGVGGNGLNGCHTIASVPTSTKLTFATNAAAATYTDSEMIASPSWPAPFWGSWSSPPSTPAPMHYKVGQRTGGSVTCASAVCALTRGGDGVNSNFDVEWTPGTKIFIAGSSPTCANNLCTVASMTDALDLTLVENLTVGSAAWSSANFGILVKKTTNSGAINVAAAYDFVFSAMFNSGLDGSGDTCNSNAVTISVDAQGNTITPVSGYLCVAKASGVNASTWVVYTFIPSTGETRLLARNWNPNDNDYTQWIGWSPTAGNSWFVNRPGRNNFYKVTYSGDYRALTPGFVQITTESATPEQLTFTDIFAGAGNDPTSQIANCMSNNLCDQGINTAIFPVPPVPPQTGAAIKGSFMILAANAGNQDSPGYVTFWDVSTIPARLTWAGYSWDKFPVGYGGIHSDLQIGTGRFTAVGINAQLGQAGGNLGGPWQATPTMVDTTGTGYVSNTAINPTNGFYCPAALSFPWQALGAKPQAQGGFPLCIKVKIPGEPCSVNATAVEHANYPCPWSSAANTSLLKPIGEGDTIHDAALGAVTFGEWMLVVKKQVNSTTDIDLWLYRYDSPIVTNLTNFTCGSQGGSEFTHANGWTFHAGPYLACFGNTAWADAQDSLRNWHVDNQQIYGSHYDFGQGSTSFTYAEGATLQGYKSRPNQAMPGQIGQLPTTVFVANPLFGSTTSSIPDIFLQSYPSKRQQASVAPASEMDWMLDVRHYNPGSGNSAENPETLFGNTISRVSGTSNTYLMGNFPTGSPDLKRLGFVGWAGWHALGDISGPSSIIGDSNLWRYCYAYKAGECRAGSSQGSFYVSVPQASASSQCTVNAYAFNNPCLANHYPAGFWVSQTDTTHNDSLGVRWRRITSALVAPGRQYNFTNAKATPDAGWAQIQAEWLEGQRTDLFWAKIPPFPATVSNPGTVPGNIVFKLQGRAGETVAASFGYAENGNPANLYCTTRAEACFTSSAATPSNPFVYAGETQSFLPCTGPCELTVPAIPGRILYYRIIRQNGSSTQTSGLGVVAVP